MRPLFFFVRTGEVDAVFGATIRWSASEWQIATVDRHGGGSAARQKAGGVGGMQIHQRSAGDVTIIDLSGKLTLGEGDELLRDKVNSLVQQGQKKLVLNLAGVPYIDSAGLGEIVRTYTTVSRQGGALKLLSLTKRIQDLLAITKLLTIFETFDTEADAVKSFSSTGV